MTDMTAIAMGVHVGAVDIRGLSPAAARIRLRARLLGPRPV